MPTVDDKEEQKKIIKEAISEWLDKKYSEVGKWALNSLIAAAFAGMIYLALKGQGWSK